LIASSSALMPASRTAKKRTGPLVEHDEEEVGALHEATRNDDELCVVARDRDVVGRLLSA
jgi:hypothetical protein